MARQVEVTCEKCGHVQTVTVEDPSLPVSKPIPGEKPPLRRQPKKLPVSKPLPRDAPE